MKRITICIPEDLYNRYKSLNTRLNISQIASKAIEKAIEDSKEFDKWKKKIKK